MPDLREMVREIHRRSLWQVLGIYIVGAWLVYQVILGLTEGGILPDWFPGVAVGLFLVGLPIVLATAFVQEGPPGDRRARESPGPAERGAAEAGAGDGETSGSEGVAPGGSRLERLLTWRKSLATGVFVFVVAGLVAIAGSDRDPAGPPPAEADRSIAVLPLENMSPDPDAAYFTDGMHEEIITHLFKIDEIRTLARASVLPYRESDRSLGQVAGALGVRYVLVGSVRRLGDRSRVSVSLVEPRTGEQLWTESYEATGTDVFAVQASIARNVAAALEAELSPGASARLAAVPTVSSAAYDEYLRGREFMTRSYGRDNVDAAIRHLERAVEADPDFALAHALLGQAHSQHYWFHYDRSDERRRRARAHIDRALRLDPDLPEAHFALARFHYWVRLAYPDALEQLDIASVGLPGDPEIPLMRASVFRRAGQFEDAIGEYERATDLDPNAWAAWWNLGETYALVRRYDDAVAATERAVQGGLNLADAWVFKALMRLHGHGSAAAALATLDSVSTTLATGEYSPQLIEVEAHLFQRRYDRALAATRDRPPSHNQFHFRPPPLTRGLIHRHAGDPTASAAALDSARATLEAALLEQPEDVRAMSAVALALAGLGRDEAALRHAHRAVELLPPDREAWRGAVRVQDLAVVQVMTGRHAEAIESLDWLWSNPTPLSRASLELDPAWDPLRGQPGFDALLRRARRED